ncbi:FAD dependent oxidoreductase [Fusarium oxysporum f. sp. phaseoli]
MPNFRPIDVSGLPRGKTLGFKYNGLTVNLNLFLPWIMRKLKTNGVCFDQMSLCSMDDPAGLSRAEVWINASGLGAGLLVSDEDVISIRGQTMFVKSDKHSDATLWQGSQYICMIPRPSDGGVILGGFSQPGDRWIEPDPSLRRDILDRVNAMTKNAFLSIDLGRDVVRDIVVFRPARSSGIRPEREGHVIHAYGLFGLGYLYAFGVAERIRDLVGEMAPVAKL